MAARKTAHEKVMDLVERELKKDPKASTTELYEKARRVSRTVSRLSIRQFHAKYPLQVKRRHSGKKPKRPSPKKKSPKPATRAKGVPEVDRAAIRDALLSFARELTAAEGKAQLIDVLSGVDKHVEKVLKAARRG